MSSLRWRLVLAFALLVMLATALGGLLSYRFTANNFEILLTNQSIQRAANLAPLLETSYLYNDGWSGLDALLSAQELVAVPLYNTSSDNYWVSNLDWTQIAADSIGISVEQFFEDSTDTFSWGQIAEKHNVNSASLYDVLWQVEVNAVQAAQSDGLVAEAEANAYLQQIKVSLDQLVLGVVPEVVDWNQIIADALGISAEDFFSRTQNETIVEIAAERGVTLQQLRTALLIAELTNLKSRPPTSELEAIFRLAELRNLIDVFLTSTQAQNGTLLVGTTEMQVGGGEAKLAETPAGATPTETSANNNQFAISLLGDERLLVLDKNGVIVYDSLRSQTGQILPENLRQQGITLTDITSGEPIGTAVVAAGQGYYTAQQAAFLRGVSNTVVISSIIAAVLSLLVGWLMARTIIAPVSALTTATQQIADGGANTLLPIRSNDELGRMSQAFNRMATSLNEQKKLRARLVSDITHELNTPLSIIQLEMQAMVDNLQSPETATAHVKAQIESLRNMVNDLTLLGENQAQHISLTLQAVELAEFLAEHSMQYSAKAKAGQINLQVELCDDELWVNADPQRLSQIFANLMENAIRHTEANGAIWVKCFPATSSELETLAKAATLAGNATLARVEKWGVVQIKDNGSGIRAEHLPHIFERFYRADDSRSREKGGRGLGLSIAKQLVELQNGIIWAESTLGSGSQFSFCLPLPPPASPTHRTPDTP
ncbi:MAG TPA: ATP-binding protein [Anaerolineales bacterium]|nr:ATP-binding protein [Anaerolineales bacterium]